jgi:hypothetical protein
MLFVNRKLKTAVARRQTKERNPFRFNKNPADDPSVNAILVSNTASECSMSYLFILILLLIIYKYVH